MLKHSLELKDLELHWRGGAKGTPGLGNAGGFFSNILATVSCNIHLDWWWADDEIDWEVTRFTVFNQDGNPYIVEPGSENFTMLHSWIDAADIEFFEREIDNASVGTVNRQPVTHFHLDERAL